jgi:hypothetical protein
MPIIIAGPATLSSVRFDALSRIRYESEHFSRSLGPPYFSEPLCAHHRRHFDVVILILLRHEPRADIMSKAAENDTLLPAQSAEPAVSQDVDEMIAEAKAVDAHFERARHRALNFASAVAAYLLPRPDGPKADLDRSGDKPSG